MWNRLVRYFGYGSRYESYGNMLPVPVHIYRTLMHWEPIAFLKTQSYRDDLKYVRSGAEDRLAIEWLLRLIDEDLGYALFQAIRRAKHALSDLDRASISFFERGIEIKEPLYLREFEDFISEKLELIEEGVGELLRGHVNNDQIDVLFLTGGSSLVRPLQERILKLFPKAEVERDSERFNSVSAGLAMRARELGHSINYRPVPRPHWRVQVRRVGVTLGAYRSPRTPLAYWRSRSGYEVDFVFGERIAIEAKATKRVQQSHLRGSSRSARRDRWTNSSSCAANLVRSMRVASGSGPSSSSSSGSGVMSLPNERERVACAPVTIRSPTPGSILLFGRRTLRDVRQYLPRFRSSLSGLPSR